MKNKILLTNCSRFLCITFFSLFFSPKRHVILGRCSSARCKDVVRKTVLMINVQNVFHFEPFFIRVSKILKELHRLTDCIFTVERCFSWQFSFMSISCQLPPLKTSIGLSLTYFFVSMLHSALQRNVVTRGNIP